tara:strand:- start:1839 stop:2855 length:1017 start_codon:yes stop_codon:yes gene_type:complete
MISVGIVGASGYTGEELTKILQSHPEVKITSLTSRAHAGKKINDIFKLKEPISGEFQLPIFENLSACDLIFFATPNGIAMEMAQELIDHNIKIIDISADFRLSDPKSWEKWYGKVHEAPALLQDSIYGLPEIPGQKKKIHEAKIVANPGCYPTSALLALLPIYKELPKQNIIIDSKSGISGAGRNLNNKNLFSEGEDNFQAYAVKKHRHYPEILQILHQGNSNLDVLFVPHLSSMIRGIFTSIYLKYDKDDSNEILNLYKSFYKDSPFVEVCDKNTFPKVSDVACTNNCKISLHNVSDNSDTNLVIFTVIDNLVKGASGQAIQNMNIMFNFDEKLGLT